MAVQLGGTADCARRGEWGLRNVSPTATSPNSASPQGGGPAANPHAPRHHAGAAARRPRPDTKMKSQHVRRITRYGFPLLLLVAAVPASLATVAAGPATHLKLTVDNEPYTVFRQTQNGWQRQVPLHLVNDGATTISACLAYVIPVTSYGPISCWLEPIPPGESHDVIWVPSAVKSLAVEVKSPPLDAKGYSPTIARCDAELPPVPLAQAVFVPRTAVLRTIPPLSIRGANYLPRDHPWPGLYREATVQDFESDFNLMRQLSMNSMRTFAFYDPERQLYRNDGSAATTAQKRLNDLLAVADRHHIKVVLNIDHCPLELVAARHMFKTILGPFADDGRILMVDIFNEPGGAKGPKSDPAIIAFLQYMYPYTHWLMPNHLLTVGLAWQLYDLWDLGIHPDVAQYHDYSAAVGRQPPGQPHVRNISDDLRGNQAFVGPRPLLIGEFGHSTAGPKFGGVTEERQREIYEGVLEGAEDQRIAGVMNWTLFDFRPDWMGTHNQFYGIVRTDGSLKPAGELLRQVYRRWEQMCPAPWDPPAASTAPTGAAAIAGPKEAGAPRRSSPPTEDEDRAAKIIEFLSKSDFEQAHACFDPAAGTITVDTLKEAWQGLVLQVGAPSGPVETRCDHPGAVFVRCQFEKATLIFEVAFSNSHQANAIYVAPQS
jgi:hypothetical protein